MATISAPPRVVGGSSGSLGARPWGSRQGRPTPAVPPRVGDRRASVAPPDTVDLPWRLLAAIAAVFVGTLLVSGVAARVGSSVVQFHPTVPVVSVESAARPAHTVVDGDTLWSISEGLAPQADPRATVVAIRELNGLSDGHVLQVGEVLLLPQMP